jgi:hypothetical protein
MCQPASVSIKQTSQYNYEGHYTFSEAVYTNPDCMASNINASDIKDQIQYSCGYYIDVNLPFQYLPGPTDAMAGFGPMEYEFFIVNASNPGPTQAEYQQSISSQEWSTIQPDSVVVYYWKNTQIKVQNSTCCIPNSIQASIPSSNSSQLNLNMNFGSSVASNPWCYVADIQPGVMNLTADVFNFGISTPYITWSVDLQDDMNNDFDIVYWYSNSTLSIGYGINANNTMGRCSYDFVLDSTSATTTEKLFLATF